MLHWSILFIVVAIIAGLLGFTEIAGASYLIAKVCFVFFLIAFVLFLVFGRAAF